jgi:molybdate transport system substrate-binding protein
MSLIHLVRLLVLMLWVSIAGAEEVNIAVASNFTAPMKEIVAEFEKSSGHQVRLSFGSSGKFFAQIKHGAPFMVFFSADQAKPQALEKEGLVVPSSRFTYAIGALALWSIQPGVVDSDATRLKNGNFNKLALANPKLAPYGAAALQVLDSLALREVTRSKWVKGENIAQTFQFVSTGNADIGFVGLSQIMNKGNIKEGSTWIIPSDLYSPIQQDAVLLQRGESSPAARALLRFVRSDRGKEIIHSYGYKTDIPDGI